MPTVAYTPTSATPFTAPSNNSPACASSGMSPERATKWMQGTRRPPYLVKLCLKSHMDTIQASATFFAIALAWLVFRVERHGHRVREVSAARATLSTLGNAMEDWGKAYLGNEWDDARVAKAGIDARDAILKGSWYQVFRVPVDALTVVLASSAIGDLITRDVAKATSFARWQVERLNQYVDQQTQLVMNASTTLVLRPDRRSDMANLVGEQSRMLHAWAIKEAKPWYVELCEAIDGNRKELETGGLKARFFKSGDCWVWLGDVGFLALMVGALAAAIYGIAT